MSFPLLVLVRYAVFAAFALAVLAALGAWLVRTRRVSPFGPVGRRLRQLTDPMLRPIEGRVVRAGGSPAHAGWWLVVGVAILGVIVVEFARWLADAWYTLTAVAHHSRRELLAFAVRVVYDALFFAIFVRVIASWFGQDRHSRWMRPVYLLTDWLVEPIRRLLPPTGAIDLSPLVAMLVLYLLKMFVFQVLF